MSKGPSSIITATKAVDAADRAMQVKHRMRLRSVYRAALNEIVGAGVYDEIDIRSEDLIDSMIANMAERAGAAQAPSAPTPLPPRPDTASTVAVRAIETALERNPEKPTTFPGR